MSAAGLPRRDRFRPYPDLRKARFINADFHWPGVRSAHSPDTGAYPESRRSDQCSIVESDPCRTSGTPALGCQAYAEKLTLKHAPEPRGLAPAARPPPS
jgi:hypothetical protein